jgi:tetratricopeptide (TPR) repeat protein
LAAGKYQTGEVVMTRFYVAMTLSVLMVSSLSQAVSAQGISEYGAALGASSATTSAASRGAGSANAATAGLYNSAAGSIMQSTGGGGGGDNGGQGQSGVLRQPGDEDLAPLFKQQFDKEGNAIQVDPRATVLTVGKVSNKLFADAQLKEKQGKLLEAEQLYMRAIRMRNRFWGDSDPAVLKMYMILGHLEMKRGYPDSAEGFFKRALQASLKRYGTGSYENLVYLEALGDSCYAQKKYDEAGNYFKQIHELRDRKLGPANAQTVSAVVKLANAYAHSSEKGYWPDAEELLRNALPVAEQLPNNKPQLIAILDGYHYVLEKEGKNDLADSVLTRLTDLRVPSSSPSPAAAAPAAPAAPVAVKENAPPVPPAATDAKTSK